MKTLYALLVGLGLIVVSAGPLAAATVSATLDPSEISVGDSTQLTVTVSGSDEQPTLPKIDGLEIQAVSQGTQFSIVNGSISRSNTVTYAITPQRAGAFTIPALQVGDAKSAAITLRVTNGASGMAQAPAASQPPPGTAGSGPVVMPNTNTSADPGVGRGRFGTVQISLPKKECYEGELVPIEIKLFIPTDLQCNLNDVPQFTCEGCTLDSLSHRPEQTQQEINGQIYNVCVWHSALTAIKAGEYPLTFSVPMTVVVPRPAPRPIDNDSFDSFFRDAFAAMNGGERKNIDLKNDAVTLKVLPLPQANRPANFTGAVGRFAVEATASPNHVNVGDPVTFKVSITGRGNFERVTSNGLPSDANWKTYSTKSHFDAADSIGFEGTKTFEQPVIANNASVTSIPAVSFSYFDPEVRDYETVTSSPVPLIVDGAPAAPVGTPSAAGTPPTPTPPAPVVAQSDLRLNRIDPGAFVATLRPLYLSPLFLGGQMLPLLGLLAGLFVQRQRRALADPNRRRLSALQQSIRQEVAAMDAAMAGHRSGAFFVHARNALQQRYAPRWNIRPEAITANDLDSHLGVAAGNVRTIFEMADQASYSDLHLGDADLAEWRQVVMDELAK